jgi:hypothetical protein
MDAQLVEGIRDHLYHDAIVEYDVGYQGLEGQENDRVCSEFGIGFTVKVKPEELVSVILAMATGDCHYGHAASWMGFANILTVVMPLMRSMMLGSNLSLDSALLL